MIEVPKGGSARFLPKTLEAVGIVLKRASGYKSGIFWGAVA
jgi:hypothetical protein